MLLLGERYREHLQKPLQALGQETLFLPDNPAVDERLAGHTDLSVFRADDRNLFVTEGIYNHIVNFLTNKGYTLHKASKQGKTYPVDAGLCLCTVGNHVICNPRTADPILTPYLSGRCIPVTQGYTKCSICVVNDTAIITSDTVIASRASQAGIDVLPIEPGHIFLEGFETGFIGGASIVLGKHLLGFTGRLDAHPDKDRIHTFLKKHNVRPIFLTEEPIFDIGGAVVV